MSYTPVGWKDYPDKTTPMSSANFRKMDEKILELDTAMGEVDISGIGDGTVKGAIASQKEALENTNKALTASDNTHFRFGINENGEYGYIVTGEDGADTVIPFKKGSNLELITHTSTSESGNYRYNHYDLTSYEGYENFTEDNFLPIITNISYCSAGGTDRVYSVKPTLQYDKTAGILKYISRASTRGVCDCNYSVNMYLIT